MELLDKVRKVLRFLAECLSPWIAMGRRDDLVQHGESLTMAVIAQENDNNKAFIYIKERKTRMAGWYTR